MVESVEAEEDRYTKEQLIQEISQINNLSGEHDWAVGFERSLSKAGLTRQSHLPTHRGVSSLSLSCHDNGSQSIPEIACDDQDTFLSAKAQSIPKITED